ncbi:hypothetical protein DICPUDRAFT_157566 [Dictyostelium purpureum]|uniref:PIPK domain-containing protein n=1 Tax=Dictyostelium purpureum TaxID=5786 RepID=F0ZZG2_DICPU|nr:uncharacterized protein DICPUDRAFT_157566 [Dictyostelium purpureum]EGC30657.1 hypothetical protein DICPUDRAFT_157566 [Dictyostelium purpureum]|eukprot:XP_003292806.1 hypothetical protein DICPUDRAFT_157566 [Dictyostelium purpureum]
MGNIFSKRKLFENKVLAMESNIALLETKIISSRTFHYNDQHLTQQQTQQQQQIPQQTQQTQQQQTQQQTKQQPTKQQQPPQPTKQPTQQPTQQQQQPTKQPTQQLPTKPLLVSIDPKLLNKASPPTAPQQPNNSSTPTSSSHRSVLKPFNILKYSKNAIEETLYRPSANVNQSKKLVQDEETQQYINLLTIGFKKLFEINNSNGETNQKEYSGDFSKEDFKQETNIKIPIDSSVDLDDEQIINQFHLLEPESTSECSSSTVTTIARTTSSNTTVASNSELSSSTASLTSSLSDKWQFTIFSPKVFKAIRKYYNVDNDFLRSKSSIGSPEIYDIVKFLEVQTVGRSGSFFYKSEDSKYFLKTIPWGEYETFTKLFPSYYQHIMKYPNSLLPRFLGVFRLKGKLKLSGASYYNSAHRDIIFVVMVNLFYTEQKLEIKEKYDLKGSTIGRYVDVNKIQQKLAKEQQQHQNGTDSLNTSNSSNQINGVDNSINIQTQDLTFKDLNLKRNIHLGKLKKVFIQQLSIDSEWMCSHGICDYSLLVGLHISDNKSIQTLKESQGPLEKKDISYFKKDFNGIIERIHTPPQPTSLSTSNIIYRSNTEESDGGIVYYLGLIDILTTYNLKKRGENALKGMFFDRTKISAVNPKDYQSRFLKYIESIFD